MESLTYEQAIKKLEEKVSALEKGDMSLDDTVKLYDEAVKLSGYCAAMLNGAKLRISELSENGKEEV